MGSFYGIALIVVLVLASGLIAYLGDIVGRRMGRKRLTLWGLRPRHTAIIISVVAGMCITLFTLAAAMAVSSDVREGLTQVGQMRQERTQLQREVATLRVQRDSLQDQRSELARERDQYAAELDQSRKQAVEQAKQLKQLSRQAAQERKELNATAAELRTVRDDLLVTRRSVARAEGELAGARTELGLARKDLVDSRTRLASAEGQRKQAEQALSEREKQLASVEQDLQGRKQELKNAEGELQNAFEALVDATRKRDTAVRESEQAKEQAKRWELLSARGRVRTVAPIFSANQPILSTVISGDQSKEAVRSELERFLGKVSVEAEARGVHGESGEPAINLSALRLDEASGQLHSFDRGQMLDSAADQIWKSGGQVVVEAYSQWNAVPGEQVLVDFHLYQNQLVFRRDEKLAETMVNARANGGELMLELIGLLRDEVGAKALQAGMVPLPPRPDEGVIADPSAAVGEIRRADLLHTIDAIQRHSGQVKVSVLAAEDTYSAGPLKVRLAIGGKA
jgi:uncharacterized protein (DUF3084 family)